MYFKVAIKFRTNTAGSILRNKTMLDMEIQSYKKLSNIPGIPKLISYGNDFIAMQLLGPSLSNVFQRNHCSLKSLLIIAEQVIARLESIHARDVYHLDIKSDNVLLGFGSNSNIIYLIDFGNSLCNVPETMKSYCIQKDLYRAGALFREIYKADSSEIESYVKRCEEINNISNTDYNYLKQIFSESFRMRSFSGDAIFE